MNDLIQEVKDTIEKYEANRSPGEWCTANDSIECNSVKWMKQLIERLETAQSERDEAKKAIKDTIDGLRNVPTEIEKLKDQLSEAVKALEWYGDEHKYELIEVKTEDSEIELVSDSLQDEGLLARTTLKRIKGSAKAEGHQSTESDQAPAGGRIGGSYE